MPPLLLLLLTGSALAAPIAADTNADVVATYHIAVSPQAITDHVSDLRVQESLLSGCTRNWIQGSLSVGVGASAQLVYRVGLWRRKLTATITEVKDGQRIIVDHAGDKGFYTTWTVTPTDGGADVELRTLMELPPRPFQHYYMQHIQPEWQSCYAQALVRLENELGQ
ncbi:MAG: SRPBCC family protein [Oligoflexia bacterium]|nr:SRPBCC family protein [Oligoflexia bacterium]